MHLNNIDKLNKIDCVDPLMGHLSLVVCDVIRLRSGGQGHQSCMTCNDPFDVFPINVWEVSVETMKHMQVGPITSLTFWVCIPWAQNVLIWLYILIEFKLQSNCFATKWPYLWPIPLCDCFLENGNSKWKGLKDRSIGWTFVCTSFLVGLHQVKLLGRPSWLVF